MSDSFYDREYDPKTDIPNFAEYFTRWKNASLATRSESKAEWDLAYGPTADETLDYFPAQQPNAPLLVFVHGGYWRAFHKDDFSWIAPPYVEAGISVAIVNYALAPEASLSTIVDQVRRSIAWLHTNANSLQHDPNRIVCSGHSAGGHLTAMALATDWAEFDQLMPAQPLRAAVAISGLFDLEPVSKAQFLQSDLALDADSILKLSPTNLQPSTAATLLTVVGQLESSEFHRQCKLLVDRWGDSTVLGPQIVDGANHFDVCDFFANKNSELFQSTHSLCFD